MVSGDRQNDERVPTSTTLSILPHLAASPTAGTIGRCGLIGKLLSVHLSSIICLRSCFSGYRDESWGCCALSFASNLSARVRRLERCPKPHLAACVLMVRSTLNASRHAAHVVRSTTSSWLSSLSLNATPFDTYRVTSESLPGLTLHR
jgi:hypothetical protein